MARQRDVLVNFERMWHEIDELMGAPMLDPRQRQRRGGPGFVPRVDVYYSGGERPLAVVVAELAGIAMSTVTLEVAGRELVIAGERPMGETEGRVYQQLEIERGRFRRVVELGADVISEQARATYEDGILRVELPLRRGGPTPRRVPIETPK